MENVMQFVADKKYTEFSNAVKNELMNKLGSSSEMKTYISDYDKIQQMKSLFSQINNIDK